MFGWTHIKSLNRFEEGDDYGLIARTVLYWGALMCEWHRYAGEYDEYLEAR